MRQKLILSTLAAVFLGSSVALAATFVVPTDRQLVSRAGSIVIATALPSFSQLTAEGGIETVTPLMVEETIAGDAVGVVNAVEPGGQFGNHFMVIPGAPRFETGKRMLLFLNRLDHDRWVVTELVLGKFTFEPGAGGARLLVRDATEIAGWDGDLKPHRERQRLAEPFVEFVRAEAHGVPRPVDYFTDIAPLRMQVKSTGVLTPSPTIAPFTATSYTMLISGSRGSRWNVFPNSVSWFSGTTTEPGAPGGGTTAIQTAMTSWDNDCGSNVNYAYAGTDDGSHAQGLHAIDGRNTVLFERDLSTWGIAPFSCSANGYSGTLGIGGITDASGQNSVGGETFVTTVEGDVEMNRGIANCTLLFNNGDWNSAVTHELGHTLGFRHADQDRASSGECTSDPSLECSNTAIMKSFINNGLNAALQTWDQHAVQAVYPGNVCAPGGPPPCTAPSITAQPASATITAGGSVQLGVNVTGTTALSYQWFAGSSGNTASPVSGGTGPTVTVSPASTTNYWVRVSNSCGTADSTTATVSIAGAAGPASSFVLLTGCRLIDTRSSGPALGSGSVRTVQARGVCGISAQANGIALNITVVSPSGNGWLTVFPGPAGSPVPFVSTLNYGGRTLANNALLRVGSDGTINVFNSGPATVHFIVDVNGYFQ